LTRLDAEAIQQKLAELEEKKRIAHEAKQLLDHPVLKAIFEDLEQEAVRAWRKTDAGEFEAREEAYRILRVLDLVRGKLRATATTAAISAHNVRSLTRPQ
jgi:hypothetical protein